MTAIKDEWMMELLEMHATHADLCDFERYRPRMTETERARSSVREAGAKLQHVMQTIPTPEHHARIAFTIVAYKDAPHLQNLIEAIHLPHHLIIIHLEQEQRSDNDAFFKQTMSIASSYSNVVIVSFGTILYKTDSVSRVNLQLMNWLADDLQLEYDYHVTLGGAVYPLYGASELARHLYSSRGNVWLGEMTHKGMRVQHPQWSVLWKKRVLTTRHKVSSKVGFVFDNTIPEWMNKALQHKSVSGNQAVFSMSTVKRILETPRVQNIFALAKYGCCCCIEERTWIAAMDVLGLLEEAKERRSMHQVWGGDSTRCRGTMQNAVLDTDETRCFRLENPDEEELYVWGNSTWDNLVKAKRNGVLFARKFHSEHEGSVNLLLDIRRRLHGNSTL
jgi:hypothetical protein